MGDDTVLSDAYRDGYQAGFRAGHEAGMQDAYDKSVEYCSAWDETMTVET